jgi:hypothetical protein
MRICLLFLLVSFLLLSCKNKDDSSAPNPYAAKILTQLNRSDSFLYYSPGSKNKWVDSALKQGKKDDERYLKLQSLEKGFDSIQIRIRYGCVMGYSRLIILSNSNNKWKAEISKLNYHWDSSEKRIDTVTRSIHLMSPKSGWVKFINELFDLKILTLPDEDEIPNFERNDPNDGCGATIEIATKNTYRYYLYDNPDVYKYWQTKNMMEILRKINEEFGIKGKWEWPSEHQDTAKTDRRQPIENKVELQDSKQDSVKQ